MIRQTPGLTALQTAHAAINPKVNQGVTGASTASPKYDYGHQRLLYVLNNRRYSQNGNNPPQIQSDTTVVNQNSEKPENLYISRDLLGYQTPMSAEEQLKLVEKYSDKNMERDSMLTGMSSLSNAFGKTGGFSTVFGSYTPR